MSTPTPGTGPGADARGGLDAADVLAAWRDRRGAEPLDLEVLRSVTSTNDVVTADLRRWRAVVAEHQSAGRGRRGRRWESPVGAGLAMTVVLPAPGAGLGAQAGTRLGWYPLAAGVALADAVREETGLDARLKWPNDLLVPVPGDAARAGAGWRGWGKAAGLLAERPPQADVVVLGAGLNVDHRAGELSAGVSLAAAGARIGPGTRARLVAGYLGRLSTAIGSLLADGVTPGLRDAYRGRCHTLGAAVVVHRPGGGRLTGTALDVAPDGALLVRDGDGVEHAVHAGDVEHVRPAGA